MWVHQWSLLTLSVIVASSLAMDYRYHSYADMTAILRNLTSRYPTKSMLVEIGKSQNGKSLWAVALSAYSPDKHVLLRPEVKYIGNMHGNEVVGLEVLLYLIEYLMTSDDSRVVNLMDRSRIWIMPSMNPDGLEISRTGDCSSTNGRFAADGTDLNRNFPDQLGFALESPAQAKETTAVISWLASVPFVLSANYHGGAFVVNTPLDRYYVGRVSTSSDDDIYQKIAHSYVNRTRVTEGQCADNPRTDGLVIRGADWYEVTGGMQDYGYFNYGTIELTMEISCCKYPNGDLLANYWDYNRDAMLDLLSQAQRGVKGLVLNENNQPINSTEIMIDNRRPVVKVTSSGEFWRVLLPGSYTLKVLYRGNLIHYRTISIESDSVPLNLTIIIPSSIYSTLNATSSTTSAAPRTTSLQLVSSVTPCAISSMSLIIILAACTLLTHYSQQ